MTVDHSTGTERREYFRVTGIVYLAVALVPFTTQPAAPNSGNETLDFIDIQLGALQQQIEYDRPDNLAYWRTLMPLLQGMQRKLHALASQRSTTTAAAQRQAVNISGSGMRFLSQVPYDINATVYVWLSFPTYPFTTLTSAARVVTVRPFGANNNRWHVAIEFVDFPEMYRDLVIKFVNHVARGQIADRSRKRATE